MIAHTMRQTYFNKIIPCHSHITIQKYHKQKVHCSNFHVDYVCIRYYDFIRMSDNNMVVTQNITRRIHPID